MSNGILDPPVRPAEDWTWVVLDDDVADFSVTYGNVFEMRTAPLQLGSVQAQKFADAKRGRIPRAARPLPLD